MIAAFEIECLSKNLHIKEEKVSNTKMTFFPIFYNKKFNKDSKDIKTHTNYAGFLMRTREKN